jgi:methionyl aminopeptidase
VELEKMRAAGDLLARTLAHIGAMITPGAVTADVDKAAEDFIRSHGARPAFKGYRGYPATLCISFNEQVVHGIPGKRRFIKGDLIGIDVGLELDGFFSDMAKSYYVGGEPPGKVQKFMEVTEASLHKGIEQMREGNKVGDISSAVQAEVERNGYSAVRALVGHGIGRKMHEDPQVPNYGLKGTGPRIRNGMVFAIEPMVNQGSFPVKTLSDGWTVVAADGSLSCHFEHTVAATPKGPEILTVVRGS